MSSSLESILDILGNKVLLTKVFMLLSKDETMNGNSAHKVFEDVRAGKFTLIDCFLEYPEYYNKYHELLQILTRIDTLLSTAGEKTMEQREETAVACEKLTEFFPRFFL